MQRGRHYNDIHDCVIAKPIAIVTPHCAINTAAAGSSFTVCTSGLHQIYVFFGKLAGLYDVMQNRKGPHYNDIHGRVIAKPMAKVAPCCATSRAIKLMSHYNDIH